MYFYLSQDLNFDIEIPFSLGKDFAGKLPFEDVNVGIAPLVSLDGMTLRREDGLRQLSGWAPRLKVAQAMIDASRRDGGVWHRTGVVTSGERANVGIVLIHADTDLHILGMHLGVPEVSRVIEIVERESTLNLLLVSPMGDSRLSQLRLHEDETHLWRVDRSLACPDVPSAVVEIAEAMRAVAQERAPDSSSKFRRAHLHVVVAPSMLARFDWRNMLD